ncbi:uncharacterized protein EAF01_007266 [Botrytis porri]|uniref:uncharacterized protein n=1 Tax=Botrytis porri TaxID=87229 RepID=UPI00190076DC|nr:uncharacterized protein EAF01_007266 [Botrytis porri]KAF7901968.1 hypothetical protein EAF01_007266 [Botrytis porri]
MDQGELFRTRSTMSWSPLNDGGRWGSGDSCSSSSNRQASGIEFKDNDWDDQGDFISSLHNYQFPVPTNAVKEKPATKKPKLLSLREEVKAKEEKILIDTEAFEHTKSELNKAGAQLVEEKALLIAAKSAHDTLVEEIRSQNKYLEAIRQAKHYQQRQRTWEQSLVRENRRLKEEVGSLRQLAKDHCDYFKSEVEKLKEDHKLKNDALEYLKVKEHVAAAVKEAVDKALSSQSTEFDIVGLEMRTTFLESHRSRIGVSFDETDFEEVAAWLKNARKMFKTTVDLNLALDEIERTHNSDSTQTYDRATRRRESDRMILKEILKKKEFCATLRALPQQAGFAIRSRHLEWPKSPQGRDMTIIEKGGEVAHYADALLDAVIYDCFKPLIKVINWFAHIKQWRTNRGYLKTDFVTEGGKLGIYPFTNYKADWLKLPEWDSIFRELESLYPKEENMNKIKSQRVDQPTFLEVDQIRLGEEDSSSKETHSAESPIMKKSPTEESSKPGMSRTRYFKNLFVTPPHRNSGLPLQPVPLDWNRVESVSSVKLSPDESQNPIDDGWGPCTVTTKESSLEDMRGASPAALPVLYPNPMREDWNRTIRGWRGRTARGGRTTRGRVSRGGRGTRTSVCRNDLP